MSGTTVQQAPFLDGYRNAQELFTAHQLSSLPHIPPQKNHTFPATRFPDKHTKTIAYALCPLEIWSLGRRRKGLKIPQGARLVISGDILESFQPQYPLPLRADAPISATVNPLLYHTSKKWRCLMEVDKGDVFVRAGGENALQGLLFAEEGVILSQLFALNPNDGRSKFFQSLPPKLMGAGWYHGMTKNRLKTTKCRIDLSKRALEARKAQIQRRTAAEKKKDYLANLFEDGKLTRSGSIPDHAFGRLFGDAGIVLSVVEEKRMYPGGLKDVLRFLAHYGELRMFLGSDTVPEQMSAVEGDVWVGSPQVGPWYAKVFWQVYAECNSMNAGHFVITDRFHSIFGRCNDDGLVKILHIFTHCPLDQDDIETPLDVYHQTQVRPAGVKSGPIPPIDPMSPYDSLHSNMNIIEAYTRILYYADRPPIVEYIPDLSNMPPLQRSAS